MFKHVHNIGRAQRWQALRTEIRLANRVERLRLIRAFGGEIQLNMPKALKSTVVERNDLNRAIESTYALSALIAGWLLIDPANPMWPGRDRLFVVRREDLINACWVLAAIGCFSDETVPEMITKVDFEGRKTYIPGIEAPGAPIAELPDLIWKSAVMSTKSKEVWRKSMNGKPAWADEDWAESGAVWRTCAIFDHSDPVSAKCRDLLADNNATPAGLVVIVKVERGEAVKAADEWMAKGWEAAVINRSDCLGLYELLAETVDDQPFVVFMTGGQAAAPSISRSGIRRKESGLLADLSDAQFNEIMGESLKG